MKSHVTKLGAVFIAGALAAPGTAVAANGPTAVQLELRAAADTAKAQQLAGVAPKRAYAYLRRSRSELAAAYRTTAATAAGNQERTVAMTQRLRTDAKSMRSLAQKSSGALALSAAKAVQVDIKMEAGLADQAPADQQAVAADAAADMTNTAVRGLHSTPARARAVRRAFAAAVAEGLELGRSLARRAAADSAATSDGAHTQDDDLLAQIASWASSLQDRLSGSATLSVLAGDVAGEAALSSATYSATVQGQVVPGWAGSALP